MLHFYLFSKRFSYLIFIFFSSKLVGPISSTALRAAAAAVKHEDDRRLFHNAALRKRRKEMVDQAIPIRRCNMVNIYIFFLFL